MSENEMSQQERDAAVIADAKAKRAEDYALTWGTAIDALDAALREITRLRELLDGVPEELRRLAETIDDRATTHDLANGAQSEIDRLRNKAAALRAALASASDGAGTAAGAPAGDADGDGGTSE
jgi:ABC-type transporter Mla subunit MlaD